MILLLSIIYNKFFIDFGFNKNQAQIEKNSIIIVKFIKECFKF